MKEIIVTLAPKTAGNTIITSNLALAHQWRCPQKRIGLWQISSVPDLAVLMGILPKRDFGALIPFYKTEEWHPGLIDKILQKSGIDLVFSPVLMQWNTVSEPFFRDLLKMLSEPFDCLYIDLDRGLPEWVIDFVLKAATQVLITVTVESLMSDRMKIWNQKYPVMREKGQMILNQITKSEQSDIKKYFKHSEVDLLGMLPPDKRKVWHQVYEGIPVMMQKKGDLAKGFDQLLESLICSRSNLNLDPQKR